MAEKLVGPLAPELQIGDGYVLRFAAVDPTDGSAVSGVTVSAVNVAAEDLSDGAGVEIGPYMLVPGPENV